MPRLTPTALALALAACGSKGPLDSDIGPALPTTDTTTDTAVSTDTTTYVPPVDTGPVIVATDHCPPLAAAAATVLQPGSDVQAALDAAAPGAVVALAAGTWTLTASWVIRNPGVTLRGESGAPASVTVDGAYGVDQLITVAASDVTIAGLTLSHANRNGILVQPEAAAITGVRVEHVVTTDHGAEHILVDTDPTRTLFADDGEISCSAFTLSDDGRDNVLGLCATGGVHLKRARGWTVRDNLAAGFWCDSNASGHAIRAQDGSRDILIERNRIDDAAKGIAAGVGPFGGRTYDDAPCGGIAAQTFGVTVQNNVVYTSDPDIEDSATGAVEGISLENACETLVAHNTLYADSGFAAAIEYQYANTSGTIANNLTNGTLRRLDDAGGTIILNIENTPDATFVHTPTGDLHLSPAALDLIDAADPAYAPTDDIDGQPRDAAPDIGADEYYAR